MLDRKEARAFSEQIFKDMGSDPKDMTDEAYEENFASYDKDGSGKISRSEVAAYLKQMIGL